jgi:streptogramin lyase
MTGMVKRALIGATLAGTSILCLLGTGISAAQAAPITEFSQGLTSPRGLTTGPDGNIWFFDQPSGQAAIGRITPSGQVTEFSSGLLPGSQPHGIESGPNGDLWFTDEGTTKAIGRVTPAGQITEFPAGTNGLAATAVPDELTDGPNGALFFLDVGTTKQIGEITTQGTVSEFPISMDPNDTLNAISAGPDGNIYFTVQNNTAVGELTLSIGVVTKTPVGMSPQNLPDDVTAGPDGNVWFDDPNATQISRLAVATGTITPFGTADGLQMGAQPDAMTAGADGNVWFVDQFNANDKIGKITPAGAITEFPVPSFPSDITLGIDGNVWVPVGEMGGVNAIARVTPGGTTTLVTAGLNAGALFGDGSDIIVGPDGDLWTTDLGTPAAIVRADVQLPPLATTSTTPTALATTSATVAGTVNPRGNAASVVVDFGTTTALGTKVAAGTLPISDQATNVSAVLPGLTAGTTYDYRVEATNAYGTAVGAMQSFTTTPASSTTTPPTTKTLTAHVGNQIVTVVTASPTACVAGAAGLPVTLNSTAVTGSHAAKLRFRKAAFFLDRGVRHTKTVRKHVHGKVKKVKVVTFAPNATAHQVPATESLPLTKLTGKTHKLKIVLTYVKTVKRHGHTRTVTVTKRLRSTFQIC